MKKILLELTEEEYESLKDHILQKVKQFYNEGSKMFHRKWRKIYEKFKEGEIE